jgi:hypothetical protein
MSHFCAKLFTTITTFQSHGDGDQDALKALSSKELIDFAIADFSQTYFLNQLYPVSLPNMQLAYLGPRWASTRRLSLQLTGSFHGEELSMDIRDSLKTAVGDFLSSPPLQPSIDTETEGSKVAIGRLMSILDQERPGVAKSGNNSIPVYYDEETLQIQMALFRKVQSQNQSAIDTPSFENSIIKRFDTEAERLVDEYLKSCDSFFDSVHSARVVKIANFPSSGTTLAPLTSPTTFRQTSSGSKSGDGFNVSLATTLVALVPTLILVFGGGLAFYYYRRKNRQQKW